ncbi:response regulator [Kitasatospora acidiphila]|uniref:response regulator n=1 Tax=Kitasatospora acidiphila TaxID=2567942 RepID=UPI003C766A42
MSGIRVVIVDDHDLIRAGLRLLVDSEPDLTVAGEAGDGREAVEVVARVRPDVVLMDVQMPGTDGVTATRLLSADPRTAAARVLVLTTYDTDEHVFGALAAGAGGFVLKTTPPPELLTAIRTVAAGEALLAPSVTRRLIAEYTAARPVRPDLAAAAARLLDGLTAREREVLELVARGLSNPEIAARLRVGPATVKTHMSRLLAKTNSRDRAQLVVVAYESGLIRAGFRE